MLHDFYSTLILNDVTEQKDGLGASTEVLKPIMNFKGAITAIYNS